jgi:hypothetical protein
MKFMEQLIQRISEEVTARLRYSASVDDRETVGCFLADQEIKLGPRKIAKPVVDHRSSGQPAQSTSQYACRAKLVAEVKCNP